MILHIDHCLDASQDCTDGSVRLVNGVLQQEGRVEVCSYGLWGTVCQGDWNAIDAYIVCNQLGYTGTGWSTNNCNVYTFFFPRTCLIL